MRSPLRVRLVGKGFLSPDDDDGVTAGGRGDHALEVTDARSDRASAAPNPPDDDRSSKVDCGRNPCHGNSGRRASHQGATRRK